MKMKKGFVWLPVLLGVLAVLAVSGGAYWYGHQKPSAGAQEQLSQPTTSTVLNNPKDSSQYSQANLVKSAQDAYVIGNAKQLANGLADYYKTNSKYPQTLDAVIGMFGSIDTKGIAYVAAPDLKHYVLAITLSQSKDWHKTYTPAFTFADATSGEVYGVNCSDQNIYCLIDTK